MEHLLSTAFAWTLLFGVGLAGIGSAIVWLHEDLGYLFVRAGTVVITVWTAIVFLIASMAFFTL